MGFLIFILIVVVIIVIVVKVRKEDEELSNKNMYADHKCPYIQRYDLNCKLSHSQCYGNMGANSGYIFCHYYIDEIKKS